MRSGRRRSTATDEGEEDDRRRTRATGTCVLVDAVADRALAVPPGGHHDGLDRVALGLVERRADGLEVGVDGPGLPDDEEAEHEDDEGERFHSSMTVTPRCANAPMAASSAPASSSPIVRPIRRPGSTAPDSTRRSSAS